MPSLLRSDFLRLHTSFGFRACAWAGVSALAFTLAVGVEDDPAHGVYDARTEAREILTPAAPAEPRITGATIFGVRPGKPIRFRVSATGEKPVTLTAVGLPDEVTLDPYTGWITGRAPQKPGDIVVQLAARNTHGTDSRTLTLRVGDTICLTPPMGWNSWYVHSEGVSDAAVREIAAAMEAKGLADHGWTYLNIDDCWMGLRDPVTKAIQPNAKFGDMRALAGFVNARGLKLGLYSTPWMSTYAGYIGGSAPNEAGDYSEFFLPESERQNPHQLFGRYPNGIRKGLARIGPVWFVDHDARQFADWGIDYVKYDWKEWALEPGEKGFWPDDTLPGHKTAESGITRRVHDDFRALDRDIVISLSPAHDAAEDRFVPDLCNLWRLTPDIHAEWSRLVAPFSMEERLQLTRPGHYGDLDMLQIGPLGKPNRAEVVFKPSPLTPAEQYFQVTLWCVLTQPLLLSCHVPTMDTFDLNLVTNDEVLAVNQDPLCRQGYRVAHSEGEWEIWVKDLADGGKAMALFNLSEEDRVISVDRAQLGISGELRDLWRQKDLGALGESFAARVSPHGVAFVKVKPPARAHALTVGEGFTNPLGFHDATPTFSWKLPPGMARQTAYRIEVSAASGEMWDSGWVESDRSTFVPFGGARLSSRDRVTWRVKLRGEAGAESGWSEPAIFEMGLLSAADWTAKWIRPAVELPADTEPVACLRRVFPVAKEVVRARLYVTARGLFEIQINGQRVGRDHFANGFTSYKKRIDTLTYDVTSQLRGGDNTIEGLLGTGWYAGRFPFETPNYGPYGRDIALLAQLEIHYADGSAETIISDEFWECAFDGPIVSSSLYDGEVYDAHRRPTQWAPVVAEADLGGARLTPKPFAPVCAAQTLEVQKITEPQPGCFVFDLGQNMAGWARIRIPVEKDHTVTVRFAEMLQDDGTLYTANYRSAKSTDTYTAAETGRVEWEPHFTFHGFRYVELSGLPAGAAPQPDWVVGVVLRSDLPTVGRFMSSHAKLNQLQSNITWGWHGNSFDIPTDCPQRDERMGWTGDAQVFCATSMFNTGAHAFWKSWLGSLRDDQYDDGAVPPFAPTAMSRWVTRSPGWMDAATVIPWEVYVRTGDADVLAENYDMMERLVAWYRDQAASGALQEIRGFGDWLQPYSKAQASAADKMADRRGDTPRALIGAAFFARSARILADAARVLGRAEDAGRYADEAERARAAFCAAYFDETGRLQNAPETQTAYVLAIAFDLLPQVPKVAAGDHLVRLVRGAGGHLRTGFLGTPFIAQALDETGHVDVAAELLFRETYPSWFFSINQGATTMWERWNSYTRDDGFGDVAMNSFNHYAYGAIGQWMYERVAGLAPDPEHPGYKHFFVRPLLVAQLDSARAELETPYGSAVSGWVRKDGTVTLSVRVPPNTTATIEFPDGRNPMTVPAGSYTFAFDIR